MLKGLFALPLACWVLTKTTSTKQAHLLLGMQAAKLRWEESTNTTPLKNIINPTHQHTIQAKTKKHRKQEKALRKKDEKHKTEER
jgi:hypothetical protein